MNPVFEVEVWNMPCSDAPYATLWLPATSYERTVQSLPSAWERSTGNALVGAFQQPEAIERVLANGEADIVAMARGTIADPYTVEKIREGRP